MTLLRTRNIRRGQVKAGGGKELLPGTKFVAVIGETDGREFDLSFGILPNKQEVGRGAPMSIRLPVANFSKETLRRWGRRSVIALIRASHFRFTEHRDGEVSLTWEFPFRGRTMRHTNRFDGGMMGQGMA